MLYVIQVFTSKEHRVAECCRQALSEGQEIFVPLYKRQKKIRGKLETVTLVLYPGYIFCETDDPVRLFAELKGIKELTKLLRSDEDIIPVEPKEAEALYKLFGQDHVVEVSTGYIEGGRVRITAGPLEHFEGQIIRVDRHKRAAVIELDFMGRKTQTTVGLEVVDKIP
ncbi:MAG: antiterminator LoaP [Oscillospiraceae bacterium]|nr:antiterminator LoaP [Oscillospiraceae bacterium]MBQ8117284.1 antiterminator LoaP [Lachnospiraceae bacterium]